MVKWISRFVTRCPSHCYGDAWPSNVHRGIKKLFRKMDEHDDLYI